MTISLIKAIRAAKTEVEAAEILDAAQELEMQAHGRITGGSEVHTIAIQGTATEAGEQLFAALGGPLQMLLQRMLSEEEHILFWGGYFHSAMQALANDMGRPFARGLMSHLTVCEHVTEQAAISAPQPSHQVH